jgi:hypothetical protein
MRNFVHHVDDICSHMAFVLSCLQGHSVFKCRFTYLTWSHVTVNSDTRAESRVANQRVVPQISIVIEKQTSVSMVCLAPTHTSAGQVLILFNDS